MPASFSWAYTDATGTNFNHAGAVSDVDAADMIAALQSMYGDGITPEAAIDRFLLERFMGPLQDLAREWRAKQVAPVATPGFTLTQ